MKETPGLPDHGPLPKPSTPDEARTLMKEAAFEAPDVQTVKLFTMEFTSLCPRTGQPDFGSVSIEYLPDALCLESKSLKYYLWSYRDEGEFCEGLAGRIADDIVCAIRPAQLQVEVTQNVRGGIGIVARAIRGS
jgi:7-cyano-7-deazaguanine reductase